MNDLQQSPLDYAAPETSAPPAGSAGRRRWVALGVVAAILLVGAVGLNGAVASLKLSFQKLPVALRHPVLSVPAQFGPWVQVTPDVRFSAEIEEQLATLDYLDRWYVDLRKASPALRDEWAAAKVKDEDLSRRLQQNVVENDPFGAVKVHVAYYTGGVDTVPHIPERCMVAGGFDPTGQSVAAIDTDLGRGPLNMSFVQFQQHEGRAQGRRPQTISIAYVFQVNGDYEYDAIAGVRKRLQNLFETYGYFAKIEVMTAAGNADAAPAKAAIGDFLHSALPEIETVLPDWNEVEKGDPNAARNAARTGG